MNMKSLLIPALGCMLLTTTSTCLYAQNNEPLPPVVFESTNYSRGFDPTTASVGLWWTSVCQESAVMNLAGDEKLPDGSDIDLNVNNHIEVHFTDDQEALKYTIELDPADTGMLTLALPSAGLTKKSKLTLTGKVHTRTDWATIKVYPTGEPGNVVASLYVYVLPLQQPKLGIWRVKDVNGPAISNVFTAAEIWDAYLWARKVYRQACCLIHNVNTTPPTESDITRHYDTNPQNTALDASSHRERYDCANGWPKVAELNVGIVKNIHGVSGSSNAVGFTWINRAAYVSEAHMIVGGFYHWTLFRQIVSHELGHQFHLSGRVANPIPPPLPPGITVDAHDTGPFPSFTGRPWPGTIDYINGIMFPVVTFSREWLWNGDWRTANDAASQKTIHWFLPPPP